MGTPSKGDRRAVTTRVLADVDTDALARGAGYSITGQYVADLIYAAAGRNDLIDGPDLDD